MCGITGNFGFKEELKFSKHLKDVEPLLQRRGPDQLNIINIDNFYAAHSRLIVQGDSEDGIQPMKYQNIVILFNGNLYNKDSLKSRLESYGYIFKGVSDTEVVAISVFHWGLNAFNKFNGFFSIASYDSHKRTLTLARDRVGQKPLYYSVNQKSVFFGS
ncbi:asparagine synthetase B, partial [Gammaproteobacteria bacterium]|nr:asparagine synthetase B [Gammaproteobacteria bacterium]